MSGYHASAADKADIRNALDRIKATDVYVHCKEDYDFNITAGVDHIEAFLSGDIWQ